MTVDDYMKLPYKMEITQDPYEGGYVASFPDLSGCLTCADTLEELIRLTDDAKRVWFEDMLDRNLPIPEPKEPLKISSIKILPDHIMLLTFSRGEVRLFDADILDGEVFEPLKDDAVFHTATLEHGIVTWMDGDIDCSPEYMYKNSYEYPNQFFAKNVQDSIYGGNL